MGEVLGPLARRQHDSALRDAVLGEAGAQWHQMVPRDRLVGDDDGLTPAQQREDLRAGACDQPGTDQDVVAALAEFDAQPFDRADGGHSSPSELSSDSGGRKARSEPASAAITRVVVSSSGPSPL